MKILITGVAGFIGYHLAKRLCNENHVVTGIDNLDDYYDIAIKQHRLDLLDKYKNFSFIKTDLKNLGSHKCNYDLAINLAAQAGVRLPKSAHYKYEQSNVEGFKFFLKYCNNCNIKNILFASSSSVYGNHHVVPFNENSILPNPINRYAESKIKNEIEAKNFYLTHEANIIGLRFFTVYGPFGRPDMAYFKFTNDILREKKITLFNNGELERDMTYIDDVVDGLAHAINYLLRQKKGYEIFNLGNEKPVKTSYLLTLIENELGKKGLINYINNDKEVKITYADSSKAFKAFGFNPRVRLDVGVSEFIRWYKTYFKV